MTDKKENNKEISFKEFQENITIDKNVHKNNILPHITLSLVGYISNIMESFDNEVKLKNNILNMISELCRYSIVREYKFKANQVFYKDFVGSGEAIQEGFIVLDLVKNCSELSKLVAKSITNKSTLDNLTEELNYLQGIHVALGALCHKYQINIFEELHNKIK